MRIIISCCHYRPHAKTHQDSFYDFYLQCHNRKSVVFFKPSHPGFNYGAPPQSDVEEPSPLEWTITSSALFFLSLPLSSSLYIYTHLIQAPQVNPTVPHFEICCYMMSLVAGMLQMTHRKICEETAVTVLLPFLYYCVWKNGVIGKRVLRHGILM